jgi:hypothetical protein
LHGIDFPPETDPRFELDSKGELVVDAVFTYVNSLDSQWQSQFTRFAVSDSASQAHSNESTASSGISSAANRFRDWGELRYSMRSLFMYARWVRRIHVVVATESQVPDWLNTSDSRIRVVYHKDILPAEVLPTFNSLVIESALHRIPGLAPHFLYFNNDVFLNRVADLSRTFGDKSHYIRYQDWLLPSSSLYAPIDCYPFVAPAGSVIDSTSKSNIDPRKEFPSKKLTQECTLHFSFFWTRALVMHYFGTSIMFWFAHVPHFFHRRTLYVLEAKLALHFDRSRRNRLREPESDISMLLMYESFLQHLDNDPNAIAAHAELIPFRRSIGEANMGSLNYHEGRLDPTHQFYTFVVFTRSDIISGPSALGLWYWDLLQKLRHHGQFIGIDDDATDHLSAAEYRLHRCRLRVLMHLTWHQVAPWESRNKPDPHAIDAHNTKQPLQTERISIHDHVSLDQFLQHQCGPNI